MAVSIQVSEVIDRRVADVFRFYALEHVQNHPRWDPNMHLEKVTDGPIRVGTVIKRVNSRSGTPVEGTMEILEFELDQVLGMVIHDGPVEMLGRATFQAETDDRTKLILHVEIPGVDESADTSVLASQMQGSLSHIKQLIEADD